MTSSRMLLAIALVKPFYDFIDSAGEEEQTFRNGVMLAFQNFPESPDRFLQRQVFAGSTGKLFCNAEGL